MLTLSGHSSVCWTHKWSQGQGKVTHQFQVSVHQSEVSVRNSSGDDFKASFSSHCSFAWSTQSTHSRIGSSSGSSQLIGHHLYLFHFAWGGVDVNGDDMIELFFTVAIYDTLLSPLKHIPLLYNFKYNLIFPNPWNNCPIYLSLKIDQDLVTSQPNSRTLLETSLAVQ